VILLSGFGLFLGHRPNSVWNFDWLPFTPPLVASSVLQISNPAFCYLQVDLFFYTDPEEAEAVVAPEYGAVAEYIALPGDTWGGEWGAGEVAPAPVPATGAEWTAASGLTLLLH
jgi:hypothetical protein